jgi:hypothetical protein
MEAYRLKKRNRIRISIKVKGPIRKRDLVKWQNRIRIKVMWIRDNKNRYHSYATHSSKSKYYGNEKQFERYANTETEVS